MCVKWKVCGEAMGTYTHLRAFARCKLWMPLLVAVLCCSAAASAEVEFCPARIAGMAALAGSVSDRQPPTARKLDASAATGDVVSSSVQAASFSYRLQAEAPRTIVAATMIADTNRGWFAWAVRDIRIAAGLTVSGTSRATVLNSGANSNPLKVTFPETLLLRHAWVTSARATGDKRFGWNARGAVLCKVPPFHSRGVSDAELWRRQTTIGSVLPSPPPIDVAKALRGYAQAVAQPFPITCVTPFRDASVVDAVPPDFHGAEIPSNSTGGTILATVGEHDNLVDARVLSTSGSSSLDAAMIRAAQESTYSSALSYCQKTYGTYLFKATFHSIP
jgi:hypothetical protein